MVRKKKEKTIQKRKEDDIDVIEDPSKARQYGEVADRMPAVDFALLKLINVDLKKFLRSKASNDAIVMDIFQAWADLVRKKRSIKKVKPHGEIFPDLMKQYEDTGKSVSKGTMTNRWKRFQRLVIEFFEDELGKKVVPDLKKKLKMSSDEVILYEAYRRRFAAWVLNPIMRYRAALTEFRAAIQV